MFKKLLTAILCFILVFSLTACNISFQLPVSQNESTPNTQSSSANQTTNSSTQSSNKDNKKPNNNTSSSAPVEKPSNGQSNENKVNSPTIEVPIVPDTSHTPVSRENYYQYSHLTENEKKVYNDICAAIEATQNVINLSKYRINYNKMWGIYQKVIADNPQYFWVSKFIEYTHFNVGSKNKIIDLILFYTDGEVTDNISNNKLTTVASRKKIADQISQVNRVVEGIIENIPFWYSEIEKEYLIHDAVIELVTYDSDTANKEITRNNYTRIYDIYGAAVNEKAVCEGYSRLFQYLCYLVGINSTIVVGTANDEPHAWNAVQIDFYWYHTDVTWDENYIDYFSFVNYNNLTLKQITNDHDIDYSYLVVPETNGY